MVDLSLFDLTGKKALVTGAAVGIGRGCALALARAGADVAVVDIDQSTGPKTVAEIRALGRDSLFVPCDVTKKDQVQAMVRRVAEHFTRLDIGINNAGIGILGADEELEQADWDKVIDVNLTGTYLCAQAETQQFLHQDPPETGRTEGKIINIASLAAEWGRFNINVNCISPSYLLTPMHASTPVVVRERIRELTPMGYVERPEDLAGAVIFLASAASHFVTGLDLVVDGGHTLNAWLVPLKRAVPPRVGPEEEIVQLKHDLDALGYEYDADGINPDVHPEVAGAFKAGFGIAD